MGKFDKFYLQQSKRKNRKQYRKKKMGLVKSSIHANRHFTRFGASIESAWPRRKHVSMKYTETVTLTTTALNYNGVYSWRINSINEPSYTAAGHRPIGYDEWGSIYQRSTVYAVSYKVTAFNTSSNDTPFLFGIWPTTSTDSYNPASHPFERMQEKRGFVTRTCDVTKTATIKGLLWVNKVSGVKKQNVMYEDDWSEPFDFTEVNPNIPHPVRECYLTLVYNEPGGATSIPEKFNVELVFHCVLTDPKTIIKSSLPEA